LLDNWTDEQFEHFWQARNQRIVETDRALNRPKTEQPSPQNVRVSAEELLALMKKRTLQPHEFDKYHA